MIGLLALAFVFVCTPLWIGLLVWLIKLLVRPIKNPEWREPIGVLLFVLLFPLPIIDEIIGKYQFERICQENSMIRIDREKAKGRIVYLDMPPLQKIKWSMVPIQLHLRRYFDVETGDLVASYAMPSAFGGALVRVIGFPEGRGGVIFNGYCGLKENPRELFKQLGITVIDRPTDVTKGGG